VNRAGILAACLAMVASAGLRAEDSVRLHAAGSLRPALTEVARAYTAAYGAKVQAQFGASGLLRGRLDGGEPGDVFASADMGNPLALARAGRAGPVVLFARNRLCAIARPGLPLTPGTVLQTMLAPDTKLGTSTPRNDPAGDYAWQVFAKADAVRLGAGAMLDAKALKLTGAPGTLLPPDGRNVYAWQLLEGRADLFLAYCTAGREAVGEAPDLTVVELPPELAVGAEYGLTVLQAANAQAALPFVLYVLSAEGQAILARYGFDAPLAPR
jgi:ABC-type molybdate transport system substrate-binding protein